MSKSGNVYPEAYEQCKGFILSDQQLLEVMNRLTKELEMGLSRQTHERATVKCHVTYVPELPTGNERGRFLALDMSGRTFRIVMVTLNSQTDVQTVSKNFLLTESLVKGPIEELFDHMVEQLEIFISEQKLERTKLPMCFTFSYPVKMNSIASGKLLHWKKGIECSGLVGNDVVQKLQESIGRRDHLKVHVVALINDTTGTLVSCAWNHHNCCIGLVVGSGCNACYVEKRINAEMFEGVSNKPNMLINTEWSNFGDNGVIDFVRTKYDKIVGQLLPTPGHHVFDKCVAAKGLGELIRQVIIDLMQTGVLFHGQSSELLNTIGSFQSKHLTQVASDTPGSFRNLERILHDFSIVNSSEKDLATVHYICEVISTRSANLVAAGLACLIKKMNKKDVTIGVDGNLYRFHPHYHNRLMSCLKRLLPSDINFKLVSAEDGAGRGSALVAALSAEGRKYKH